MTDTEKIKWAIERNQSEFVRICEHCFEHDCNNCYEKNYHVLIDNALKGMMNNNTAIDAVPVVHGHWKLNRNCSAKSYYCSVCLEGESDYGTDNYCPNCRAKMNEEV